MQDQNEIDFVVAVCRIADALERIGDVMETSQPPFEKSTPAEIKKGQARAKKLAKDALDEGEAAVEVAKKLAEQEKEPAPAKKKRASRKKKATPKAQTEIDTDGITLEELSQLCQDYCSKRGKAGAERIRKFLAKQGVKKIGELDSELQESLATNLRK